ncbi:hypothetical protein OEW28_14865 [Defluviimonas sp. WL0002]|uniref:Uncharacterized protein n=1 Tax=Albidovulum marisflavi TaxID=2984159 RepID=A0ABT2ZGQ8_9RHOB|nr:hypothetical protein [Defluviimonas sp. WL0002]MCV2869911.1 hypothetical protein [Defluviimonas sp. WL0002]
MTRLPPICRCLPGIVLQLMLCPVVGLGAPVSAWLTCAGLWRARLNIGLGRRR